jgi:hypothetical protein
MPQRPAQGNNIVLTLKQKSKNETERLRRGGLQHQK